MKEMQIDALCAPGHKGLLGPQGCGVLVLKDGIVPNTLIEGGSGYNSLEGAMPKEAPERYEAGTLPTPAIAGLLEGVQEVKQIGLEYIHAHESALFNRLYERLESIKKITVYAPHHIGSVLLFSLENLSADRVGAFLNDRGFCVRTGFHCAALAHTTLRTPPSGAIRVSPSLFNTVSQIDAFAEAVKEL